MKLRKTNKKGFTLVELIVVIAIIAIIAAIAIPTTIVYVGKAYDTTAESNAKSVISSVKEALTGYALEDASATTALDGDTLAKTLGNQLGALEYINSVSITTAADGTMTINVTTSRDKVGVVSSTVTVSDYAFKIECNGTYTPGATWTYAPTPGDD